MKPLKIAIGNGGFTKPLKTGEVDASGLNLQFAEVSPITKAMRGMVRRQEWDICEMAFATYLCAKSFQKPITAIPVFLTRKFHHGSMFRHTKSDARNPKDLERRTVGVNRGYTVTTGIWARGILQSEYGVDLRQITWAPTDDEHVEEFRAPENVDYSHKGQPIVDLLLSGKVAAAVGDIRSDHEDIQPLIPDAGNAGLAFFRRTGVYPINHLLVIRNSCLEENPNLAEEVFRVFRETKAVYMKKLHGGEDLSPEDAAVLEIETAIGDPFPLGIEKNRRSIVTFLEMAVSQHVIAVQPDIQELFASGTLELEDVLSGSE